MMKLLRRIFVFLLCITLPIYGGVVLAAPDQCDMQKHSEQCEMQGQSMHAAHACCHCDHITRRDADAYSNFGVCCTCLLSATSYARPGWVLATTSYRLIPVLNCTPVVSDRVHVRAHAHGTKYFMFLLELP
jgi:hypothetical protein